ncbi:hypothetical protein [Sulfobacillus thermosulfidooxidans]|uniref:hypothetical protein n=1 Tax=Sulfobacillus thermosulfidooxidans TaxID=28034 RepID=UPI0006B5E38B|nr:hypothetical protein [Sulfobacillus thermosulfidooxidans]
MGSFLPPSHEQATFYTLFLIIAAVVFIIVTIIWLTRKRQLLSPLPQKNTFPPAYEWLARALGSLWLLDGFLQAQPSMITRFLGGVLAPLISGQPWPLNIVIKWSMTLWSFNPVLWNELATWLQIGIGLAILLGGHGPYRRIGLWISVFWGTAVWVGGEALGGIFVGGSILEGAPGSVLLYVLAAIFLLAPEQFWHSPRPIKMLQRFMAGLWFFVALLQALPSSGWWNRGMLSSYILSMAEMPQPHLFSLPLYIWVHSLAQYPLLWNITLTLTFSLLGFLWTFAPSSQLTWWLSLLITFSTWWFGQDFGVLGGMGTDPNTGAILLVILITYAQLLRLSLWHRAVEQHTQFKKSAG